MDGRSGRSPGDSGETPPDGDAIGDHDRVQWIMAALDAQDLISKQTEDVALGEVFGVWLGAQFQGEFDFASRYECSWW